MFGSIISINDKNVLIENLSNKVEASLLGVHIVFEEKHLIVGEIVNITKESIEVVLVGEFVDNIFHGGIIHRPSPFSLIRVINTEEVISLLGKQDIEGVDSIYIGKSTAYQGFNVSASLDDFFSNHFAIIGNTGSGKSSFVARLFQNLFFRKENVPVNSRFLLFDVYGEYNSALSIINRTQFCRYKSLTSDIRNKTANIIKVPPWFLDVDDWALLLEATDITQLSIIEKALKYVYLFKEDEEKVIIYKDHIIAKSVLGVLASGRTPVQIRDQVIAVLTSFNTANINLDSKIMQPGYVRTLKQCLNVDQSGKINTIQLVIEYLEQFINENLVFEASARERVYSLKDLHTAFEFALLNEGVLKSDKVYDMNNILKVRLEGILNSAYSTYFDVEEYISIPEYLNALFTTINGEKAQIVNMNLNFIDERFAKTLTKIYSKMIFNYSANLEERGSFSVQIVLEEAHRYVQNDNDINVIGYNIFDRITKEGRKYGVILGLITQRLIELSSTALSQCSNYIIFRMYHPGDLNIVKDITYSVSVSNIEKLKSLRPGVALCFGNAFNIPLMAKIDMPNPKPDSANIKIAHKWIKKID